MLKIYSIEDNKDIQELLKFSLTNFGYEAILFSSAEELFSFLDKSRERPDLFLMDIMLPGMSGDDAMILLKKDPRFKGVPVILLTAKATEMNIVRGLESGADDYIAKPFSVMELSARIKANIRKTERPKALEAGGIRLDSASREAYLHGKPVSLTLKEFDLLYALVKSPDAVCERGKLLDEIWGYEYLGETRTLDMHIRTLRGKLGKAGDRIVTVRGIGYKYCP
ncbi:DNA-binding response regulator [Clostridia bacterium]|nr:DNA-binding response regulator [Clostridia bacterium]